MTNFFITLRDASQRRLLPLLAISSLLQLHTTAVAAEPAAKFPDVLTVANSDADSAVLALYQPLPKQSIAMPQMSHWQDANTRVKELGGWMFYASEADTAAEQPAKQNPQQHLKPHSKPHLKHHHHADKSPKPAKDQP